MDTINELLAHVDTLTAQINKVVAERDALRTALDAANETVKAATVMHDAVVDATGKLQAVSEGLTAAGVVVV